MSGFPAAGVAAADRILTEGVATGVWPGVVAAVGTGDELQGEWVLGHAEKWAGGERPMTRDTVFDVASLTKVMATLPAVLTLVGRGRLGLETPAAEYLPAVDPRVRVRHLLTHTSGLPAHRPLSERVHGVAELVAAAAGEPLDQPPDTTVAYSDLGFILLGALVEAVAGDDLGSVARREVFEPAGMRATYSPPPEWLPRVASTEIVDGRPVHGRVHDENAAAAGGPVGHAGLFATLDDVLRYLPVWLPSPRRPAAGGVLEPWLRAEALRDHTAGLGGHRGLGWTCRGDAHDILSVTDAWGDVAVSHTGFTGTSLAFDPRTGRWAVLLTNAVHFGRGRPDVLVARRRFHAALVEPG